MYIETHYYLSAFFFFGKFILEKGNLIGWCNRQLKTFKEYDQYLSGNKASNSSNTKRSKVKEEKGEQTEYGISQFSKKETQMRVRKEKERVCSDWDVY